jgi:hypothetical protein
VLVYHLRSNSPFPEVCLKFQLRRVEFEQATIRPAEARIKWDGETVVTVFDICSMVVSSTFNMHLSQHNIALGDVAERAHLHKRYHQCSCGPDCSALKQSKNY